jgi:hypothetical protein
MIGGFVTMINLARASHFVASRRPPAYVVGHWYFQRIAFRILMEQPAEAWDRINLGINFAFMMLVRHANYTCLSYDLRQMVQPRTCRSSCRIVIVDAGGLAGITNMKNILLRK